ncbi:MAG: hypothetical protein R3B95_11605 [Nitrospirales bacterium]|nr:hypothetical protein [Nitrospirales bacterium]
MGKLLGMIILILVSTGCAQHGLMLETDDDFKGELGIGWGPTAIVDGNIAGGMRVCVPSKKALEEDGQNNWCRSWMEQANQSK